MLRKTHYEQVSLEFVKRVVKKQIERDEEKNDPERANNLEELRQQEKLLTIASKVRINGTPRKTWATP